MQKPEVVPPALSLKMSITSSPKLWATSSLSPEQFDLAQPVRVMVNGLDAFEGTVPPSVETLLKWFAKDNDRTMLFAAEVHVRVPSSNN